MSAAANHTSVKGIIARSGALGFLERAGLRRPLSRAYEAVARPRKTLHDLEAAADYLETKRRYRFLAHGAELADPERRVLILHLATGKAGTLKTEAILAKALQLSGMTPVVASMGPDPRLERYYRLFGITDFVRFTDFGPAEPAPAAHHETCRLFEQVRSRRDFEGLEHQGLRVGRHALSTMSMDRRQGRLDLDDAEVREAAKGYLAQAVHLAMLAGRLMDEVRPERALVGERGYFPFAAAYEAAVRRGVDTVSWNASQRSDALVFKRYAQGSKHVHHFTLSPETWEQVRAVPWTESRERELREEIARHYQAGIRFQGEPLQAGKHMMEAEEVRANLSLDPAKKTAVVFSHVLWDGTVSYGNNLFEDYEQWLVETVRAACANPNVNWVVKFHPANLWKTKTTLHSGELWDRTALRGLGELPGHVKLLAPETRINTASLFGVTDYAITVRGTIGIEMPCYGIRVFTAGSGRYSGFGFTEDSSSPGEYLDKMARIQTFEPLTEAQVELAKKHAHALFLSRPWPYHTFEQRHRGLSQANHPLNPNVIIHARSLEELRAAPDLRAFVQWATQARTADFLTDAVR